MSRGAAPLPHLPHTALVTGAAQGIGRAICEALGRNGMRIVALDKDSAALRTLANDLAGESVDVLPLDADVSEAEAIDAALATVAQRGWDIDVLVPCAAIDPREDPLGVSRSSAQRQFAVNLLATLQLVAGLVPGMQARRYGRVIAIGSVQEERPRRDNLLYAALKAAQTHAVRSWARDCAGGDVTFNVVRPGAIETRRNRDVLADPVYRQSVLDRIPLKRLGQPHDCAGIVAWLCTDAASYVNGAVIDVDGGMRL